MESPEFLFRGEAYNATASGLAPDPDARNFLVLSDPESQHQSLHVLLDWRARLP